MRIPLPFPGPPIPIKLPWFEGEEEEAIQDPNVDFIRKMRSEGFDPELVEMGLKVAKNHMRPVDEAFKIGENYIREMAK